jgi:hypothetical protein
LCLGNLHVDPVANLVLPQPRANVAAAAKSSARALHSAFAAPDARVQPERISLGHPWSSESPPRGDQAEHEQGDQPNHAHVCKLATPVLPGKHGQSVPRDRTRLTGGWSSADPGV